MNRRLVVALLTALFAAGTALAQQPGGSIKGTVKDETGAALPGAAVSLSGAATRSTVTGSDGAYHFENLPAGTYKITVQLSHFGTQERSDLVVAGGTVEASFTMLLVLRGEEMVVSATRAETQLVNAPATMSVVSSDTIASSAAQNVGDLLRSVPGVNVIQTSARDINLVSREASATLTNSQLALLDGRSVYLDFFGLILWDFVPSNPSEIKQIEVVRGPASVVWGANAMTGVVNIITKTPREAPGGSVVLSGGGFSRDVGSTKGEGMGNTYGGSLSWAQAPNDTWSYRLAGGFYHSDAYPRPTGNVPICGPSNPCPFNNPAAPNLTTGGAPYPPFDNSNTNQPKFDVRVDQRLSNDGVMSYSGGYAGTRGIIHTGIGPFDIRSGSYMAYARVAYAKRNFKLSAFGNFVNADAPNLLQTDATTGKQLQLNFKTQTYDLEVGNSTALGGKHLLTYGGNVRRNNFDITITPTGQNRSEFGAYLQEEFFPIDAFRVAAGARVDKFGNIDKAVFSPRVALTYKPARTHALRVSFNKAFRAPSLINNYLDIRTFVPVDLSALVPLLPAPLAPLFRNPFPLVIHSVGSEVRRGLVPASSGLKEESLKGYEIAYTGTFEGRTTVGLAFYINDRDDNIRYVSDADVLLSVGLPPYTSKNPPPGWLPRPPPILDLIASRGILLTATPTYLNLGPTRDKGFEASIDHAFRRELSAFANYSYQARPEAKESANPFPLSKFGVPPKNRFNAGINWNSKRLIGSVSVNYADKAFWTDVLTSQFYGPTDSYTMLNASFGVKWGDGGRVVTSVKGTNLTNDDIQQHVFGDIIKRSLVGELRINF